MAAATVPPLDAGAKLSASPQRKRVETASLVTAIAEEELLAEAAQRGDPAEHR